MSEPTKFWWSAYIESIQDNYRCKIDNNLHALLCRCNEEQPPEMVSCGSFPQWCVYLNCPATCCKKKRKWAVCMMCINVIGKKKKMHTKAEVVLHSKTHDFLSQRNINTIVCGKRERTQVRRTTPTPIRDNINFVVNWNTTYSGNVYIKAHGEFYNALVGKNALTYLVSQQFHDNKLELANVNPVDAELHTLIASVAMSQSKQDNRRFAKLLALVDFQHKTAMQKLLDSQNKSR